MGSDIGYIIGGLLGWLLCLIIHLIFNKKKEKEMGVLNPKFEKYTSGFSKKL